MRSVDMLPKAKRTREVHAVEARSTSWVRASESGVVSMRLPLGTRVTKDQQLAIISSPLGDEEESIVAPYAGIERGHEMSVYNHTRCYMNITSNNPSVHYDGQEISGVEAIIPRIGASVSFYSTSVVRQFEMMNIYSLNESVAITRSRDKLRAVQLLARKGIGLPVTGFANSTGP